MSIEMDGQCLCGAVSVNLKVPEATIDACHCGMCVRWGGSAYLSTRMADDFTIEGEQYVTRYRSSEWAERGFCSQCGTHLFFTYLPTRSTSFSPGLFAEAKGFSFREEIFVDAKPDYYEYAGDRPRLTEAEVIDKYKPQQ